MDINSVVNRLKGLLNVKTNKELSLKLGLGDTAVSTWLGRKTLNFQAIISFAIKNNLDLNYIFKDEQEKINDNIPNYLIEQTIVNLQRYFDNQELKSLIFPHKDINLSELSISNSRAFITQLVKTAPLDFFQDSEKKRSDILNLIQKLSSLEIYVLLKNYK